MGFAAEVYPGGLENEEETLAPSPHRTQESEPSLNRAVTIDGALAASAAGLLNIVLFELVLFIVAPVFKGC